ncbi:hypothetical protein PRJ_3927 [Pseudomonas sp. XWY-1]|nr:hypothetical protein PRJ_3927 [Pseudomonas sp. XWY-1]
MKKPPDAQATGGFFVALKLLASNGERRAEIGQQARPFRG